MRNVNNNTTIQQYNNGREVIVKDDKKCRCPWRRWGLYFLLYLLFMWFSYVYLDLWITMHCVVQYQSDEWIRMVVDIATYANYLGNALIYLVPLGVAFVFAYFIEGYQHWRRPCLYILSTMILTGICVLLLKNGFGRARPYMYVQHSIYGFQWLKFKAAFWSFPSGHVATVASACLPLSFIFRKLRYMFFAMILIVMIGRILVLDHYLSDVVSAFLLVFIVNKIMRNKIYENE